MSGTARSTNRTGGRATGPRQARGASTRAGGRGIDLQSGDGVVVLVFGGILATIGVGILAGPAQAWTAATWHRAVQWVTHDVRDPALEDIPVRAEGPGHGYSRAAFGKGWGTNPASGCTTRQEVEARDVAGAHVEGCTVTGGTVTDPYTGGTAPFRPAGYDVDHVVSLAEAWRSGAASWTPAQRQAFANDMGELLLVPAGENRAKGDKDASGWNPTTAAGRCLYAQRVVAIKYRYLLSVDSREYAALVTDLDSC